ncbi:MAG: Fe-S cluster assembly protein SufD [Bacteroidota bacterium]
MQSSQEIEKYLTDFHAFENNGASHDPSWLKSVRLSGIGKFSELGFPTVKQEDWRFTNILPLTKFSFQHASKIHLPKVSHSDIKKHIIQESSKSVLVFINGHYSKDFSNVSALPKEIVAGSLAESVQVHGDLIRGYLGKHLPLQRHPFAALNTAFIHDGAFVYVPEESNAASPIQLLFVSLPQRDSLVASYPRNLVIAEKKSAATIVERYVPLSEEIYFTNAVSEIFIENESAVDYIKIQSESEKAFHIGTMQAEQGSQSRFTAFSLALGGAIARNDININVNGEQCETMLDGLYLPANDQLVDHHTFIDHTQPNCSSREIFKGIITGSSRSVFNGKIFVRKEAQKTDSKQTNKNLLLSDKATVDTKPQLEIFADDVKCTHGATVGGLDDASLFYVKSRGISEEAGRALLTVGFASEVTNYINNEALRKHVDSLVIERLQEKIVKTALPEIVHSETKTL